MFKHTVDFQCKGCSKESYDVIPIQRIMEKLDSHFERNDLKSAGELLLYWEREARNLHDERGLLEILNEEIGYFRRTAEADKALAAVSEAFSLIEALEIENEESSATIFLNGATTMKAFGKTRDAMHYYAKAKEIYDSKLSPDDYRLAAYYNNVSSAYKELGDAEGAEKACYAAISVLDGNPEYNGEIAVTHVNLAHIYYDSDNFDERVYEQMEIAWELLSSKDNRHDGAFAFLCSKCYPSFAYFGYFDYEKRLKELCKRIYEGN